jgi:antitoxin component YwqK of YwqJK toxin-antitoxin module
MSELHIAEILYRSGELQYRYARYLADDGKRWVRHGLFRAYSESGVLISEGFYNHGAEDGLWRDYHPNGQLATEGHYQNGVEVGEWRFWDADGRPEETVTY